MGVPVHMTVLARFWCILAVGLLPWTYALVRSGLSSYATSKPDRQGASSNMALHAFGKPPGGMEDANGRGSDGEFYFSQQRRLNLKLPDHAKKRIQRIPIFPKSNILMPLGDEYVGVFEMRYRQLLNTVGDSGVFGSLYFSSDYGKFALVGTLTRVKRVERVDDGGMYVLLEGVGRFYVKRFLKEKPYIEAEVQVYDDHTEDMDMLTHLESQILDEIRYSVKQMKVLYPSSNYTLSENVLKYRRQLDIPGVRTVNMASQAEEISRMSKFSFATIEMLKTAPPQKLVLLQEPLLERRMNKVLKVSM